MPPKKKEPTFEAQLSRLEEIVTQMEAGGLSLEETLKYFEEGAAIEKKLSAQLEETRRRLTLLESKQGEQTELPMEAES